MKTYATDLLQVALKTFLESRARLQGKGFYCLALQGEPAPARTLTINSDMTVSCNCSDYDGSGIIGDLNQNDLRQILGNDKANEMRSMFARGRLPLINCTHCYALRTSDKEEARKQCAHYSADRVSTISVENTYLCNLDCLACDRKALRRIRRTPSLSSEDLRKIALMLKDLRTEILSYVNLGEPFLSKGILDEVDMLLSINPGMLIRTSTNGVMVNTAQKREAALRMNSITFTMGGVDQMTAEKYHRRVDFTEAYENMKRLSLMREVGTEPHIFWKYLLFRWNDGRDRIRQAVRLAVEAKFDSILFYPTIYPLSAVSYRFYTRKLLAFIRSGDIGKLRGGGLRYDLERDSHRMKRTVS